MHYLHIHLNGNEQRSRGANDTHMIIKWISNCRIATCKDENIVNKTVNVFVATYTVVYRSLFGLK